jgi:formate hydrogenlyase subunit 6/NADH:ubiquinone oxidoreductase subunit I
MAESRKKRRSALHGIVIGPMKVTLKHLFRRPVTIMYPYETLKSPKSRKYYPTGRKATGVFGSGTFGVPDMWSNYRGTIGLDIDACISCGICARICPDKCITYVEQHVDEKGENSGIDGKAGKEENIGKDGSGAKGKGKKVPQVDFGTCMFCGLCAEHCPKGCIFLTSQYDLADFKRSDLVYPPEKLAKFKPYKSDTKFPERNMEFPARDVTKCIGCQLCSKRCPTKTITMVEADKYLETHGIKWEEGKKKPKLLPEIDMAGCVSCGTCEESCPKDAIRMDTIEGQQEKGGG